MCRKQMLWGCCLMTFGIGVLAGRWMDTWFWGGIFGLLLIVLGFAMQKRK